jgi:hypothetical protein
MNNKMIYQLNVNEFLSHDFSGESGGAKYGNFRVFA